ncbi:2830_t:CDS:1, partial [Gigaspora rosea]
SFVVFELFIYASIHSSSHVAKLITGICISKLQTIFSDGCILFLFLAKLSNGFFSRTLPPFSHLFSTSSYIVPIACFLNVIEEYTINQRN